MASRSVSLCVRVCWFINFCGKPWEGKNVSFTHVYTHLYMCAAGISSTHDYTLWHLEPLGAWAPSVRLVVRPVFCPNNRLTAHQWLPGRHTHGPLLTSNQTTVFKFHLKSSFLSVRLTTETKKKKMLFQLEKTKTKVRRPEYHFDIHFDFFFFLKNCLNLFVWTT
jgi:hypothetical protein